MGELTNVFPMVAAQLGDDAITQVNSGRRDEV